MRTIRRILILLAALLVVGGALAWWMMRGPDASQFAALRTPRLAHLGDQPMLVVEASGDPNIVGAAAFKTLFNTYYRLEGVSRFGRPPSPRARWSHPESTAKDQWIGHFALPVPAGVTAVPGTSGEGLKTSITTWQYGDVAEILHEGSYSSEQPTIERLLQFIQTNGYRVIGEHEEEYVKGPGMFFAGDPAHYLTIIRLRVTKSPEAPE